MEKRLNPATGTLTWLAGASPDVLQRCGKSEQMKFAALGATVLIPAGVGFFACWYTVFSLTKENGVAILMGIAWALMLVAIDRAILITYKKGEKQAGKVLLRMFLAGVAGILVAHILVLYVFRDLIAERQNTWRQEKVEQIETLAQKEMDALRSAEEARWLPQIQAKESEIANLASERDQIVERMANIVSSTAEQKKQIGAEEQAAAERHATIRAELLSQQKELSGEYTAEIRGKDGSVAGYGPKAKAIQTQLDEVTAQLASAAEAEAAELGRFAARLTAVDEERQTIPLLEDLKEEKSAQIARAQVEKDQVLAMRDFSAVDRRLAKKEADVEIEEDRTYDDILSRTEALHQIVMEGVRRGEPSAAIGYLLLVLLFFTLDTIPIITKIMLPAGTYDRILDRDLQDTESLARLESEERMDLFHTLAAERAGERIQEERLRIQLGTVRGVAKAKLDTFKEIHGRLSDARRDVAATNAGDLKSISRNMSDAARADAESALQVLETKFLSQAQNIVDEYSTTADSGRVSFGDDEDDVIKLTLRDNGVPSENNGDENHSEYANGNQNGHALHQNGADIDFDEHLLDELEELDNLGEAPGGNDAPSSQPRRKANA